MYSIVADLWEFHRHGNIVVVPVRLDGISASLQKRFPKLPAWWKRHVQRGETLAFSKKRRLVLVATKERKDCPASRAFKIGQIKALRTRLKDILAAYCPHNESIYLAPLWKYHPLKRNHVLSRMTHPRFVVCMKWSDVHP